MCYGVSVPSQDSEMSCIYVLWVSSQDSEMSCICVLGVSSQHIEMSCICVLWGICTKSGQCDVMYLCVRGIKSGQ